MSPLFFKKPRPYLVGKNFGNDNVEKILKIYCITRQTLEKVEIYKLLNLGISVYVNQHKHSVINGRKISNAIL